MIRLTGALTLLLSWVAGAVSAGEGAPFTTVQADSPQALQARLISLAQDRLQPAGLLLDGSRARLSLSERLPAEANLFEVRTAWPDGARVPPLPLTFAIRSATRPEAVTTLAVPIRHQSPWIHATLAVPLRQQVWVANRNLPKGSSVSCADLTSEYRDLRDVPGEALSAPCDLQPDGVVLRYVGRRDILRSVDVGAAPAVTAGMPIAVTTLVGGISLTITGVALADAMIGDRIEVRLSGPSRTRRVRVTAAGAARLEGVN
jgi:flagella basal body P-ring formation protein FlgA